MLGERICDEQECGWMNVVTFFDASFACDESVDVDDGGDWRGLAGRSVRTAFHAGVKGGLWAKVKCESTENNGQQKSTSRYLVRYVDGVSNRGRKYRVQV